MLETRAGHVVPWHSKPYYHPINWDIWSMMFIGMGLMKTGVLTAGRSLRYYLAISAIGYGIGLPTNSYTAWLIVKSNFDPVTQAFAGSTYDIGRLSIALGHLGLIMAVSKAGWLGWLTARLGAVGQMAFTNYVMHSIVCTIVFTGFGFKLYGALQRYQLYYVVGGIWIVQLLASPIWLRHFRFGPLEWLWRSLTYWKRQPMRVQVTGSAVDRREEWRKVLDAEGQRWSAMNRQELVVELQKVQAYEVEFESKKYQVEVELLETTADSVHLMVAVDGGTLPASISPLTQTFIVREL